MKKDTHPKYQQVLFVDSSNGHKFLCGSTLQTEEKVKFEGKEYPAYHASISSASHPFFTGSKQLVDAEGRVDKFNKRYSDQKKEQKKEEEAAPKIDKKKGQKKKG